ncbi:SDR family oxidoreductase [Vibrio ezurae]|uniref:Putative oxidoreductase n=1 Tax=Vibrio ezurae NBRC 102218 TaxID=1219080 RepID=U3CCI1_9VIBR|nr:SDR family oxidoreductase [Vibrio ezurae]GAD79014.1 putative oxidoreductase [Vibrio ezurae NBRC 102218]
MTIKQFGPKGWTPELMASQKGKTYLITGANTGAGFEASRILLSKGAKVVMLNRNPAKSQVAVEALKQQLGADADISFITLDLAKLDSVRHGATQILEQVSRIDGLICNGAIAQVATQELTADGFESHLGVNHYGHFLLCGLLFKRIDESHGRIVVVGSEGYKMGIKKIQFDDMNWDNNYHPNHTYCHSKLAQMMFGYELQNRIKQASKNVQVYVCHPGASKTSLINNKANGITRIAFSLMAMTPIVQSAEKGAYPELMCATQDNLSERAYHGPTGFNHWVGAVDQREIESFVQDKASAEKLWTLSEQQTGLEFAL